MGQRFDLPGLGAIEQKIQEVRKNIEESKTLTETSKKYLKTYLSQINQISQGEDGNVISPQEKISSLEVYKWFVAKEKTLYHALNNMRQAQATYIGYFWSPNDEEHKIRDVLTQFQTTNFKRFENHSIKKPTYIKSNDFTFVFQEIVNTYGIPMYKEINPAVFAIVTFPFLFGVMFGDVGHGSIWLIIGILLCLFNDFLKKTGMAAAGQLRYLLLLMGFFAFYNGFIYNEFFAIPLEIFGSCYSEEPTVVTNTQNNAHPGQFDPKEIGYLREKDCVYTFGVDPRWFQSDQMLAFTNNLKMKVSVIIAILQMSMGIIMKGLNSLYFRRFVDFFFEFIPQIILILALFGWMDILILAKWVEPKDVEGYYLATTKLDSDPTKEFNKMHNSPAIITTMIDIFLAGADNKQVDSITGVEYVKYNYLFEGQANASVALLLIAFVCVPLMLCVKPFWMRHQMNSHGHGPHVHVKSESIQYEQLPEGKGFDKNETYKQISDILEKEGANNENHNFSEIFIH